MNRLVIHEVGMRDGLQMEKQIVAKDTKIEWIDRLAKSKVDIIQVGSFVNPAKMPQMADTDDIFAHINNVKSSYGETIFSGLVLNERGLDRALAQDVDLICMGVSASETHSKKNTGMTTDEALGRIIKMGEQALAAGKQVQVSVQSAFGCGFEGRIAQEKVFEIVDKYYAAGLFKISLADTAGHAYPQQVEYIFTEIKYRFPKSELTCHFHNTYGLGMANVYAAMNAGVETYETAFGGLGGCPFTKTAAGNVATEDVVHYLGRMGLRKDIDLDVLIEQARRAEEYFGRTLPSYILKTGTIGY